MKATHRILHLVCLAMAAAASAVAATAETIVRLRDRVLGYLLSIPAVFADRTGFVPRAMATPLKVVRGREYFRHQVERERVRVLPTWRCCPSI